MSKVYKCIADVMAQMAKEGISKDRSNQQQGYKFRGIDDVYNALAGPMSKSGLVVLPRIIEREVVERVNKNGTALFYITVTAEFDFVCAEDGSKHVVRTYGEAMDSGDKATNKAMSAAFKYACMQAFCIPTEGDNDAEATTHEVRSNEKINDEQFAKLNELISASGADIKAFCNHLKIAKLEDLSVQAYSTAEGLLLAKLKKVQK